MHSRHFPLLNHVTEEIGFPNLHRVSIYADLAVSDVLLAAC